MPDNESLSDFLNADLAGDGDTSSTETPTAPAETPATSEPVETPAPADTATATGDDDLVFDPADVQGNPEAARRMQADYTRKMQALADQRRQFEGIDTSSLEWVRAFNEAAATNPAQARQMLQEAQRQFLEQGTEPPVTMDPGGDPWVTDTERQLAQRLERLEQQTTLASNQGQVRTQLDKLEADLGVQIPNHERQALWAEMTREQIPYKHAATFWRGKHGVEHMRRLGREEGAKQAAAKSQMAPAPSGVVDRGVEAPRTANSLSEWLHSDPELA